MVELADGIIEGRRCDTFVYSKKWIRTIDEWREMAMKEIVRIKALPGTGAPWSTGQRTKEDGIFLDDNIMELTGIGKTLAAKLADCGISSVRDIALLSDTAVFSMARTIDGLSSRMLISLQSACAFAKVGKWPGLIVNHKLADDPYLSQYGQDAEIWLAASQTMSSSICITSLVEHIMTASAKVMAGTKHEQDWYFRHDALSQLTAKSTIAWMAQKNYLKCWMLPKLGLNDGTRFAGTCW